MRVLIIVASYYPHFDGVQKVTQYQAEWLVKLGHQVTVLTSDRRGEYVKQEEHNGVNIIRINAYNKNMFHFGDRHVFDNLVLGFSDEVDCIMCVSVESFAADWILPLLKKIKCKVVLMNHGMHGFNWTKQNTASSKEICKKILRDIRWGFFYTFNWKRITRFNEVVYLHNKDYAYEFYTRKGYTNNHIIFNAVDDVFFDSNEIKENIIINVGSYNERKNQMLCLEAFYKSHIDNWKLVLIGNPRNAYYDNLISYNMKLAQTYGIRNVEILCELDRDKTIELIKKSRIYLLTSTWEAFPVSLIESMSTGASFVSTDVGIVKYLPGGITCQNDRELTEALELMASGSWSEYGKCAQEYSAENFRQEIQVRKLEKVLFD